MRLHDGDLGDRRSLRRVVQAVAPDHVVHLAAATMRAGTPAAVDEVLRTNLLGTINLVDACDGVPYSGFVIAGDASEYGRKRRPARESDACRPTTVDGRARAIATLYARYVALTEHKPIVILRLFSVFGPGDHPARLIPRLVADARAHAPLCLSRSDVARDYLYVDDVADLFLAALRAAPRLAGRVLNAGSGRRVTLAEIVAHIRALTGSRSEARWGSFPLAPHDRGCWTADVTELRRQLDWRPAFSFEDGLRATIRAQSRLPAAALASR